MQAPLKMKSYLSVINPRSFLKLHIALMVIFYFNQADAQFSFEESVPCRTGKEKKIYHADSSMLITVCDFLAHKDHNSLIDAVTDISVLRDSYSMEKGQTPGYFILDTPIRFNDRRGWCFAGGRQTGFLVSAVCLFNELNEFNSNGDQELPGLYGGAGYLFRNGLSVNMNLELHLQPMAHRVFYIGYSDRNLHCGSLLLNTGFYFLSNSTAGIKMQEWKNNLDELPGALTEILFSICSSKLK
jgi:hypothetical protein